MVEAVKPVSKGTARDRILYRCKQVPFNTDTLILDPPDCTSFPFDRFFCI